MRLNVEVAGGRVRDRGFLVVATREVLDLDLEVTDAKLPERPSWRIAVSVNGHSLPYQEVESDSSAAPGVLFSKRLRVRPLAHAVWDSLPLRIEIVLEDALEGTVADVALETLLIPATHARAARGVLFLGIGASLLLAWPAFAAEPATSFDSAVKVVFGAPLVGLLVDDLRKRLKAALDGESRESLNRQWTFLGVPPKLLPCAAFGLALVLLCGFATQRWVVTYVNSSGHDLALAWHGTREQLAREASTTRLTRDANALFRRALEGNEHAERHCLVDEDACCSKPRSTTSSGWSRWFAARTLDIACREHHWTGIESLLVPGSKLEGAERVEQRVLVKADPANCTPVAASAWIDAQRLEGSNAQPGIRRAYQIRFDPKAPRPTLADFLELRVAAPGAGVPLSLEAKAADARVFLAARVEIDASVSAAPPHPTVCTPPEAQAAKTERSVALHVPARPSSHHFELTVGPQGSAPWATLGCFPREASRLTVWLLPLKDSSVARLRVEARGALVSSWTANATDSGEASPIVGLCLPEPAHCTDLRIEVEVAARYGSWDPPQLTLPPPLSAASVTITRDDAGQSRFVGSVTCKNDRKAPIQLLRTSKLHVPPATGTLTVALDPPAKTSSRTSAGQGASSSGPSNAPVVSVWTGRDKPLLCLPEPLKTYAVMRDWSQDSCTFHPEKAEVQCKAAQPRLCKVDAFGVPLATPCACGAWRRATGFLSEQERKRLKETYNCDPSSTEVCTCEG